MSMLSQDGLVSSRFIHDGVQHRYLFPNGYGASVIRHSYSYGGDSGLWELGVMVDGGLVYDTPITTDVEGWLNEDKVNELLVQIAALSDRSAPQKDESVEDHARGLRRGHKTAELDDYARGLRAGQKGALAVLNDLRRHFAKLEYTSEDFFSRGPRSSAYTQAVESVDAAIALIKSEWP